MAISHLCLECGFDLCRVRPRREPRYGLNLILCPHCRTATVRRRHPLTSRWRQTRRLTATLAILAFQVLCLAVLAGLVIATVTDFVDEVAYGRLDLIDPVLRVYAFVVLPLAVGTWLTAGLPHWSRLRAWLAFTAVVAVTTAVDPVLWPAFLRLAAAVGIEEVRVIPVNFAGWGWRLIILAVIMTIALPGIVCGRAVRSVIAHVRRTRWRTRRRRLRLRRATE